jgi:hypothetical protein
MSFKSQPTKEAEKRINENKSKKDKEMKNLTSKFKTQITVAVTLAVVAAFAAQANYFYHKGMNDQKYHESQIVQAKADAVATVLKAGK